MATQKVVYESVNQKDVNADIPKLPIEKLPHGWGTRHTQALLLFISLSIGYAMRAQLSVSLVAMTSNSTLRMWYPNISSSCLNPGSSNVSAGNETYGEDFESDEEKPCRQMEEDLRGWTVYRVYKWDKPTEEMVLFSFFVGYTCMMLPVGVLAQRYGGKITIMVALGANGVLSILTPWMPFFGGWIGVCVCRLVQGLTQAAFYPSIHTMLGHWAPLSERGRLSAYIYTGSQFGTVVAFQVAGIFAGSPILGWPFTFWACGVVSLVCFALLAWFGAATPYEHPSISSEEFVYIVGGSSGDPKLKTQRTPWKEILTSPAVWGIVAAHAGSSWGYLFILTQIPLYMSKVLNVDIKNNGLLSSLPYISMYITSILFGFLADWGVNKNILSVVNIRRISNTIGMFVSSIFLVIFCYVESTLLAIILLVLCMATHAGVHFGFHINSIDLAPNFAGPMMALGNMVANLTGLTIPLTVSTVVGNDVTNQHKWQILFLTVAAVQIVTNGIFVVFARGTVETWNFYEEHQYDDKMENNSKKNEKNKFLDHENHVLDVKNLFEGKRK